MRLYLALWPDDGVRARLVTAQRTWVWPRRAAVVPSERLHLTLHFLGEVDDATVRALIGRLPACPGFTLQLDRAELWAQGIAALEASAVPPALLQLHGALAGTLCELGVRVEARRFRPHVTLARHAQAAVVPETVEAVEWAVRGYALIRSHAGPAPHHEPIARVGT